MPKSALPVRSTAPKGGNSMSYGQLLQAVNNKQDEVDKLKSSYQGSVPSSQPGITTKPVDSQTTQSAVAQETGVKAGRGSGEVLDSYYEKRDAAAGKVTEPAPAISGSTKSALTDKNTDSTVKNTLLSYYSKRQDDSASVIRDANPKPTQSVDETAKQLFTGAKSFVNNYITNNTYKSPSGNTNPSLSEYAYNRMQNDPTGYRKDVGDKVYGAVQKELSGEHGRAQDVIEGTAQRYAGNALNSLTSFENYALNSASDNATPAGVTDYAWNLVQNNSDAELRKQLGDKQYDMLMKAINNANIPKQREQANARRAKADNLILEGNQKVEGAKEGLGTLGQLGVDAASSGLEIFGDVLATAVTGGASLLPLGMRAMGGSEYSARQAGASEGQAIAFGVASGALEAMTERMFEFGGALRTAYGPAWSGTLDAYGKNFVEQTSRKIAKSEFGQKLAYALGMRVIGAGGEAAEEVVSGIIEPLLEKAIYNPDAKIDPMEVLHSATVGGLVGGLLGGGNILTTSVYHNDLVVNSLVDIAKANNDPKSSVYKFADTLGKANQAGQAVTGQEVSDLLELMADTAGEGATKNLYALAGIEQGSKNAQVKLDMAVADALTTVSEAITDPTTASAKVEELQKDVRILSNAMVSEEVPDSIKPYLADAIRKADANTNLRAVMGAVRVTPTAETTSDPNSMGEIGVRRGDTVSYHASQAAQESVPESVIGYDVMRKHDNGSVDYVFVDDFNNNPYPQITRQVTMDANGNMRDTTPSKPTIINDKSTLVAPDYTGFNVQEQKANETYWKEGRKRTGLSYNTTQMSNKAYFDNYMNTLKQAELRRENNERFASVIQNQGRETLIYSAEGSSPLSGERVDGYVESRAAEATERINTYGEKGTVGKRAKSVLSLMNALKKQGAQPMDAREFLGEQGAEGTAIIPVTGKAASRFANLTSRLKAQGFKEVKYFAGELIVHDGNRLGSVNGAVDVENGIVYLCVDDPLYAASQIADHELFHKIVDDNRSLMDAALKAITDSGKQEAFKKASADYMDAYAGTGANGAQVLEELLCDAYAGINIFMYSEGADAENAKVGAEQFHNEVVSAVQAAEQATATEEITEAPVETTETTEDIVTESTEEGVNPEVSSQNETAETTEENVNPAAETQETTAETTETPVETEERTTAETEETTAEEERATAETEETTEPIRIRRDRGGEWEEVSKDDAIAFAKELYGNLRNMKDAGRRLAMVNGEIQGYTITADDIGAEAQTETKQKAAEAKVDKATNEEIDRLASMDENQEIWSEPNAKLVFTGKEKSPEKYKWEVVEERPNGQVIHQFFTAKKNAQAFAKAQNEKSGANAAIVVDLTKSGALEKALDASIAANEYGGDVEYKAAPKEKKFSRKALPDTYAYANNVTPTKADEEYLGALLDGDWRTAKDIVDKQAKANGFTTNKLYHGSARWGFTQFSLDKMDDRISIFTTNDMLVAETYTRDHGRGDIVVGTPNAYNHMSEDEVAEMYADAQGYTNTRKVKGQDVIDFYNKRLDVVHNVADGFLKAIDSLRTGATDEYDNSALDKLERAVKKMYTAQGGDDLLFDVKEAITDLYNVMIPNSHFKAAFQETVGQMARRVNELSWGFMGDVGGDISKIRPNNDYYEFHDELHRDDGNGVRVEKDYLKEFHDSDPGYEVVFASADDMVEWLTWDDDFDDTNLRRRGVYELYAKEENPFVYDCHGSRWDEIDFVPPGSNNRKSSTRTLAKWAINQGYDSLILKNLVDTDDGSHSASDIHINFNPNNIKSADIATYDDDGYVIPPSQRFDTSKNELRFSRVLTPQEEETLADADVAVDEDTRVAYPDYLDFSRKTFEESRYVTDKKEAAKILANNIGITIKQATKYIDDINSIAAKIASDPTRWDYTSAEGMSSYMDNAEYVKTIDFSTICTKRRLYSGTFSAIQKAMPNTVFTENDMMEIRRAMVEARLEAPCVMCFVESSRIKMGEYAHAFIEQYKKANPNAEWIPDMYDVNTPEGAEAMRLEHPDVYEQYNYFWNTQGRLEGFEHWKKTGRRPKSFETKGLFSAQGKAKLFQSATAYDGELIKVYGGDYAADLKTIEDAEETIGKLEAEYNKAVEENRTKKEQNAAKKKVDEAKKAVEAATKRVDRVNKINLFAGIRMQSFSDFEVIHLIDAMQVVMDLSAAGLKSHAYTKVGNFARALGNTGVKINLSLVAKGVDENGKLTFNEVEGMKWSEVEELRKQYPKNVGDIVVTFNDAQLKAAMADDRIDFIIPFHRSQWTKKQFDRMGLGTNSKDYAPYQKERWLDSSKHIKLDENGKPELNENGKPVKKKIVQIPPMAYWDFSKSGKENAERYLELCAKGGTVNGYEIEGGRRPKFYKLLTRNSDGSFSLPADGSADGYWKLLIDFKMYDNDGKGAPFENVVPAFNMEAANEMMDEYQGGHQSLPVAQEFADNYIEKYKKEHPGKVYSRKFSTPAVADAVAENEYAKQNITSFNNSESSQARLAAVNPNTVARNIAKQYKSSVNITTMQSAVNELKQYAQDRISTGKTVDYDDAKMIATTIARQVVMNNPVLTNTDGYKAYAKMMKFIDNAKISIPPGVSRYIDNYQAWKTDNIDNIHVASNGIPVKNAYQALQNGFGKEAFPDGLKQYEQAMRIADVVGNYRNIYENPYTYNVDLASQFVANDILNSVFKSPDTREIGSADLASLYEAINDRRENMMNEVGRAYADGEDINIATTETANEDVAYKHANLPKSEWETTKTKGNKETKVESPTDIIARMQAEFGYNITEGHIRQSNVLGLFFRNNKGIRIKNSGDISTAAHELGHALDLKYQIITNLTDSMKDELMNNHTKEVKDGIATYPESEQLGETIAEYVREFLKNKDNALSAFPEFSKYFLNAMDEDTRANLLALADTMNAYYVEAAKSAESSIRLRSEGLKDYRPWQVKLQQKGDRLYQMWVDTNRAIYRFSQATGSNAYILATNAAYADARAGQILVGQLFDKDGYYVSEGLTAALNDIDLNSNKEYKAFGEYLVVKHGPEFKEETGGDVFVNAIQNTTSWMENRAKELEEQYPQFKKAAEKLYKFQTEFLRVYGVETGLISQDTYEYWTQNYVIRETKDGKIIHIPVRIENDEVLDLDGNPFKMKEDDELHKARWQYYVPFNRVLTKEVGLGYGMGGSTKNGFANQTGTFKKAHGSTKDIYHPVDNIMMNIIKVVKAGLSNQVMLEIADTATKYNVDANIMERDVTPLESHKFYTDALKRSLKRKARNANEDGKITDKSLDEITAIVDSVDSVITQYSIGKASGDTIVVLRNGQEEYWKINDAFLLESLTKMNPNRAGGLLETYSVISKFMTSNITGNNLIWSLSRNAPKDIGTAINYSPTKNPIKLFGGIASAYKNSLKNAVGIEVDPYYQEYLAMGGGKTSAYSADIDTADRVRRSMRKKTVEKTPKGLFNKIFAEPIELVSDTVELGPRYATYKALRDSGMSPQEAFFEACDVTVNFRRGGWMARQVNKATPFFNANVQGIDKFVRYFTAAGVAPADKAKVLAGRATFFVAQSALLAAITAALNYRDKDKEKDYEQLSSFTKNNYWCIPSDIANRLPVGFKLKQGEFLALPKPRELGLLSSFIERCVESYLGENEHAFEDFNTYVSDNLLPAYLSDLTDAAFDDQKSIFEGFETMPTNVGIFGVFAYLHANKDFLGRNIVSESLLKYERKDQFNGRTSIPAYYIGQAFNLSPQKIDFLGNQIFSNVWKPMQAMFPKDDFYKDKSLGIRNAWVKDSQYSNDLINWMYDEAESSERANNSAHRENGEKAYRKAMDDKMKSFYSNYYSLTKELDETADSREYRQAVLDMIDDYRSSIEHGIPYSQQAVHDVVVRANNTELLPASIGTTIKDASGKELQLTYQQYYNYQTLYTGYYYDLANEAFSYLPNQADRELALKKIKGNSDNTPAKTMAMDDILVGMGKDPTGKLDKYQDVRMADVIVWSVFCDKADAAGVSVDDDGVVKNNGSVDQKEARYALDQMTWLSEHEKAVLWNSKWSTVKNNPWKKYL